MQCPIVATEHGFVRAIQRVKGVTAMDTMRMTVGLSTHQHIGQEKLEHWYYLLGLQLVCFQELGEGLEHDKLGLLPSAGHRTLDLLLHTSTDLCNGRQPWPVQSSATGAFPIISRLVQTHWLADHV
jgi:hypothetical protein